MHIDTHPKCVLVARRRCGTRKNQRCSRVMSCMSAAHHLPVKSSLSFTLRSLSTHRIRLRLAPVVILCRSLRVRQSFCRQCEWIPYKGGTSKQRKRRTSALIGSAKQSGVKIGVVWPRGKSVRAHLSAAVKSCAKAQCQARLTPSRVTASSFSSPNA